jgi:hypothetical protein
MQRPARFAIAAGCGAQPRVPTRCGRFLVGALAMMSVGGPRHGGKTLAKSRGSILVPDLGYLVEAEAPRPTA